VWASLQWYKFIVIGIDFVLECGLDAFGNAWKRKERAGEDQVAPIERYWADDGIRTQDGINPPKKWRKTTVADV